MTSRHFSAEALAFDRAPRALLARELSTFATDLLSVRSYDADRRLHVEVCNISKATVNSYYGREIPNAAELGLDPDKEYRLYRDPSELAKAAPTFARLQLLDLHTAVDADDPKLEHTCGTIGSDVRFEAPYLRASLAVWTQRAIDHIQRRHTAQLSCSYRYRADMTPGVSPDGLAFDGTMRDIVGNHVALVREGRAGPDVCVNDALPLGLPMKYPNIISVVSSVLPALTETQKLALDSAMDAKAKDEEGCTEEAMDEREEAIDSREEAMDSEVPETEKEKAADRKKARDARKTARDARAIDRKAAKDKKAAKDASSPAVAAAADSAAALEEAIKSGRVVTAADARKFADDAASAAVARVQATEQARRDVAPLVGAVTAAMDSAESVYRFALDQLKVDNKAITEAAALAALVASEIRHRKGAARALATDSTTPTIDTIFRATRAS